MSKEKRLGKKKTTEVTYVFDLGLDLHVRVDAKAKVLDRPAHARVAGRRLAPRERLIRNPRLVARVLQC